MNTPSQAQVRRAIAEAQTIVVKVGSSSLTEPSGHLDPQRLNALVAAIARVRLMGGRVVLVSSGAIAAGFGTLGFDKRPTDVADQQACAAVGQGLLMAQYEAAFARYGLRVGQILITVSDTIAPQQYRNVRRTLDRLLDLGAVPTGSPIIAGPAFDAHVNTAGMPDTAATRAASILVTMPPVPTFEPVPPT